MSVKLRHEALAECHDLSVGFPFRVKVGTTLASADGKSCQGVLEHLFKTKELDDAKVNGRVQTQASLIGSDSAVELNTVCCIHMNLSLIIYPRYPEDNLTFRVNQSFQ